MIASSPCARLGLRVRRFPGLPFLSPSALGRGLVAFVFGFLPVVLAAQTVPYVIDANYSGTNLNLWGSGNASTTTFNGFVGVSWNTSSSFGDIAETPTGDFGLEATFRTSGQVGFDVMFKSTGGSVNLNLPNKVTLNVPDLSGSGAATINVTQDRSLLSNQANRIASTFPTAEFSVDAKFRINASISATAAYFDSVSGTITQNDVRNYLITSFPVFAVVNPFDISLPIVKYNVNNDHKIEVLGGLFGLAKKDLGTGFTYPLNTDTITGAAGYFVPTKVEYGNISVATITQLDARSGSAATVTNSQSEIITVRANLLGLATLAYGLPINPFQPKVVIPGTPITAEIELLSVETGVALGLKQQLDLKSNTTLTLSSNMPVVYELTDAHGQPYLSPPVQSYTFKLPEDGSPIQIKIAQKPSDPTFQIVPSVSVSPTVNNQLSLLASPNFHVDALKAGLSIWGMGGGLGPLYTYNTTPGLLSIPIFTSLNDYNNNAAFTGESRGLESLVNPGAGAGGPINIPAGQSRSTGGLLTASYQFQSIAGSLNLYSIGVNNIDQMNVSGQVLLGNDVDMQTKGLLVPGSGLVQVAAGSSFKDLGQFANNDYLQDTQGRRVPGFVDENGKIATGTYVLSGTLTYEGADVATLGSGASLRLIDNNITPSPHLQNGINAPHDALRHLAKIDGVLWLDGVPQVTDQSLELNGALILRQGGTLTAPGLSGTQGAIDAGAGSVVDARGGGFSPVSAGGILGGITLSLGDTAGGAQLRYTGPAITQNAADLVFLGVKPAEGFLARENSGTLTDGLASLANNSGTLSLLLGATQSVTGGVNNTGVLYVRDAGSAFTAGGAFNNQGMLIVDGGTFTSTGLSNSNSIAIANGGVLNAGALSNRDGGGILGGGGTWVVNGTLNYTGGAITGLASGTSLTLSGPSAAITNSGSNGLTTFADNAGTLTLAKGATFDVSSVAFTNRGTLALTDANTKFVSRGLSGQGGELQLGLDTTLDTTGGITALASYWNALPGVSSLPVNGAGQLTQGTASGALGNWTVAGDVVYTGPLLTGVASGVKLTLARTAADKSIVDPTLDLNSGGKAFTNITFTGAPATTIGLPAFNTIAGELALNSLVGLSTDASLNLAAGGRLTIAPRATLQVKGANFTVDPASTFDLQGNLILGGGGPTTTLSVPDGFTFNGTGGGGEVQLGRVTVLSGAIPTYATTGTGAITSDGSWTNGNYLIRGAGTIGGTTFTNHGKIYSAQGTLTIAPTSGAFTNTGFLGADLPGTLSLSNLTVTNEAMISGNLVKGLIDVRATTLLNNTTINGGDLIISPFGALAMSGTTNLNLRNLTSAGDVVLASNAQVSFGMEYLSTPGTTLTIGTNATLNLDPDQAFTNRGLITIAPGGRLLGASLTNAGTFTYIPGGATSLDRLVNLPGGTIFLPDATDLHIVTSTLTNGGLLALATEDPAAAAGTHAKLTLDQSTTFSGGGIVQLGGFATTAVKTDAQGNTYSVKVIDWGDATTPAGSGQISGLTADLTLINSDNTIQGRGNIGGGTMTIVNGPNGVFRSLGTSIGGVLEIETGPGGFRNQGLLSVDTGTTLRVTGGPFLSTASGALTEGRYAIRGTLQLPGIANFDTGVALAFDGADAKLVDSTGTTVTIGNVLSTGSVTVANGAVFGQNTTPTQSFTNSGTLQAATGGTVSILGGNFTNFSGGSLNGGKYLVDNGTFQFTGADILYNAADLTLGGVSGSIVDENGLSAFRNFVSNLGKLTFNDHVNVTLGGSGPILRNQSLLAIRDGANVTVSAGVDQFANAGSMAAGVVLIESGSKLRLSSGTVAGFSAPPDPTNGGGRYVLGGTLQIDNGFTTLATPFYTWGGAQLINSAGANVPFTTIASTGSLTVANGRFDLSGPTLTNNSLIKVGASDARDTNDALQDASGLLYLHGTSLAGSGTMRLYGGGSEVFVDGTFTNSSRIEGTGLVRVSAANSTFTNAAGGVIAANGNGPFGLYFEQSGKFNNQGAVTVPAGQHFNVLGGGDVIPSSQVSQNGWVIPGTWDVTGTVLLETPLFAYEIGAGTSLTLHGGAQLQTVQYHDLFGTYDNLLRLYRNNGTFTLDHTTFNGPLARDSFYDTFTNSGALTIDHSVFNVTKLQMESTGSVRVSGSNVTAILGGPGDITFYGNASTLLSTGNTNTGRVIVEPGVTLAVTGGDRPLGANPGSTRADSVLLGAGATLRLVGNQVTTLGSQQGLTFGNGTTIESSNTLFSVPAGMTGAGTLNLSGLFSTRFIAGASDVNLTGATNSLTLTNGPTLSGSLNLGGSSTLTLPAGATINGSLNGHGAVTTGNLLTVVGNSTFDGSITGTASTAGVNIGNGGATGSLPADITVDGNVTFNRTGSLTYAQQISGAASVVVKGGVDLTFTEDQTYTGGTSIIAGSKLRLSDASVSGAIANNGELIFNRPDATTLTNTISGTGTFTQNLGQLTLTNLNLFDRFRVTGGELKVGNDNALTGTVAGIANAGTLNFASSGNLFVTAPISGSGIVQHSGTGDLSLQGGQTYTGATRIARDDGNAAGRLLIFADSSLGTAPASFTAGHLYISGGTLVASNTTTLAATRGVQIGPLGATFDGTLTVPSVVNIGGPLTKIGSGTVSFGTTSIGATPIAINLGTLVLDNLGADISIFSPFSGAGNATLAGAGRTTLLGANTLGGQLTIASGALAQVSDTAGLSSDTKILGTLELVTNGAFAVSGFSGSGSLVKKGAGTVTTSGTNSFTGTVVLQNGTLSFADPSALGVPTGYTFDGGALELTGPSATIAGINVSATGGTLSAANGSTLFLQGSIGGTGTLTKTGNGTLSLASTASPAAVTYSNGFVISAGELSSVTNRDTTFSGLISGAGAFSVAHTSGAGGVTLTADNNYSGGTSVNGGVELRLGNGGLNGSVQGAISVGLLSSVVYAHSNSFVLPNTITGAGGLTQAGPGTLTINSAQAYTGPTKVAGGTLRLTDGAALAGDLVNNASLALDYTTNQSFDAVISGAGALTKSGTATTTLTAANTYAGATNVDAGTLVLTAANTGAGGGAIASGATLRIADGAGSGGGTFANNGTLELARTGDYSVPLGTTGNGTIVKTNAGDAYLTVATTSSNNLSILGGGLGFDLAGTGILNGSITGPGTLLKKGAGTLVIAGNNDTASGANVLAGTLQLGNGGTTGTLAGAVTVADGATLAYNRSNALSLGDPFSGGGALAQLGTGTLTILANFTHTGGTTIGAGSTLQIGQNGTIGSLAGNVTNNGTLVFNHSDDFTFAGNTSGTGTLAQVAQSVLTLTGTHTGTGGATINPNATLALATTATLTGPIANSGNLSILTAPATTRDLSISVGGSGIVTVAGGGTLQVTGEVSYSGETHLIDTSTLKLVNASTSTLSNRITGDGGLEKLGAGTLILTADNTFTGATKISQGVLQLGDGGTTGSIGGGITPGNLELAGGALAINRSNAITLSTVVSGNGGLTQLGTGVLTLAAANTYLGMTTVGAGSTINLAATGAIAGPLKVDGNFFVSNTGNYALGSGQTLSGAGRFEKVSAGDLDLNGPLAFTGQVITSGLLTVRGNGTIGTFTATALHNRSSGLAVLDDNTGAVVNFGTLSLGNGGAHGSVGSIDNQGGTVVVNRSSDYSVANLTGTGYFVQAGAGTTTISNGIGAGAFTAMGGRLTFSSPIAGTIDDAAIVRFQGGDYFSSISGAGTLETDGTVTLSGTNSLTGTVAVISGTLTPGNPSGIATGAKLSVASGATYDLGGFDTTYAGLSGAGTVAFGLKDLTVNSGANTTFTGTLTGSGTLRKQGTATLTLGGTDSHTGGLSIEAGKLAVGTNDALAAHGNVTLANLAGASLDLVTFNTQIGDLSGGGASGGSIALGTGRLTINEAGYTDFGGTISGAGGITKEGKGTLRLVGTNSYSGATRIYDGTLAVGSIAALGSSGVVLGGGSGAPALELISSTTFGGANPLQILGTGGALRVDGNTLTQFDTGFTGPGNLTKTGSGDLRLNAADGFNGFTGTLNVADGRLVLGRTDAVNPGQLLFTSAGRFDVNGTNWTSPLTLNGGGITNAAAGGATVSGQVNTNGAFVLGSTSGDLRFTGNINSTSTTAGLTVEGSGRVALAATPAALVSSLGVAGTLAVEDSTALTALTVVHLDNTGRLELGGSGATRNLSLASLNFNTGPVSGDGASLLNPTAGTTVQVTAGNVFFNSFGAVALLGGAGNLNLAATGMFLGPQNLAKVGTGSTTLVNAGDPTLWLGDIDVRAGTLIASNALLTQRDVNIAAGGTLQAGGTGKMDFSSLTGAGALALGTNDLAINTNSNSSFNGAITGSGNVTKGGTGFATFGSLAVNTFTALEGDTTINGSTGATKIVLDSLTGGTLHLNAAGVTTNGGTTFIADLDANSLVTLLNQTQPITTNAGSITMRAGASISDDNFNNNYGVVSSLTNNTGTLRAFDGASLGVANNFTNNGTVTIGANSGLSFAIPGSSSRLTQASGSLTIDANASVTVRTINVTGGTMRLDGQVMNFSGSPTLTLSGGTLTGSGTISGRLTLSGGVFSPGNSPGQMLVTNSTWNGGGEFRFELNALPGLGVAGTNWDLLSISNTLTIAATSANKFTIDLVSLATDNSPGLLANFDATQNYSWNFVTATTLTGFDPINTQFAITTAGFANPLHGAFSIAASGSNLNLLYTYDPAFTGGGPAVPEPSTYAALAGVLALAFAQWRRRANRSTLPA